MTATDPHPTSRTNGNATAASAPAGEAASARAMAAQASTEWWQQHDQRVYECIKLWVDQWWELQRHVLIDALGEVLAIKGEEYRRRIDDTTTKIEARLGELEIAFWGKEQGDTKRSSELVQKTAQKIAALECELADARRELADTKCEVVAIRHEIKVATDVDARFHQLEHWLAARQGMLLSEAELREKIETLRRQIDELQRIVAQPGPQGPPGPPGKLPRVKEYAAARVHYQADVVTHAGALWQARADTVHAPPHSDWICLARAGRNGCDGRSPNICGTYDAHEKYERLDIVALDGAAFIARRDNPGICPGDGWQLLSRQGRQGRRGEAGERGPRGEKGEKGEPGATVVSWQLDRERYCISPLMSDGKVGPIMELRGMFEQYQAETSQ